MEAVVVDVARLGHDPGVTVRQSDGGPGDQRDRDPRDETAHHGHAAANRALAWRTPFTVSGVSRLPL